MTYNDIPFVSARYLGSDSEKQDEKSNVIQASATNANGSNEPTISVPAQAVVVDEPSGAENGNSPTNGVHPDIEAFKQRRKRNQKIALVGGFVAGCVICGPILGVLGAALTHSIVKGSGRAKQARLESELLQTSPQIVGHRGDSEFQK